MPAPDLSGLKDSLGAWLHDHPVATKVVGSLLVAGGYYLAGDKANALQAITAILVMLGVPAVGSNARTFRIHRS